MGAKYKKRHRKELSPEEIEAIVACTKEPYRLYKDIAQQFKISSDLVCRLVNESKMQP